MDYILIGKFVGTHGIKGELKIISDFKYKDKVFKKDNTLYMGSKKEEEVISTYRKHKHFDMVTFTNYNNINQVLSMVGTQVYVTRDSLHLKESEFLDIDLIGMSVIIDGKKSGVVQGIRYANKVNKLIDVVIYDKKISIPYHNNFVKRISLEKKEIEFNFIEGMLNEN